MKDFTSQIVAFAQHLGFETVAAMVVIEHSPTLTEFRSVTNAPTAFLDEFHDLAHARMDPVLQHCRNSKAPIIWDQRDYEHAQALPLWSLQEPFGYRSGVAQAMHLGHGKHFMFGANWNHERCWNVPHFKEIAENLLSFGQHAQAAAFELCLPSRIDPSNGLFLAFLELEALRWTIDGLNAWEVGERMSISERHATLLLQRAMLKLSCSSKYEAGLRAIKLGLIQCGRE